MSRRIRAFGKLSFFRAKTIAMHTELPARLERDNFKGVKHMLTNDLALALFNVREIVVINAKDTSPTGFLQFSRMLAAFPCLRRCTLLFGFSTREGAEDDIAWLSVAFALGGPISFQMQELMNGIGMSKGFKLD
jgi:hypothetical protein